MNERVVFSRSVVVGTTLLTLDSGQLGGNWGVTGAGQRAHTHTPRLPAAGAKGEAQARGWTSLLYCQKNTLHSQESDLTDHWQRPGAFAADPDTMILHNPSGR